MNSEVMPLGDPLLFQLAYTVLSTLFTYLRTVMALSFDNFVRVMRK